MDASLVMTDWPGVIRGPSESDEHLDGAKELSGSNNEQRNLGSISVGSGSGAEIAPWLSGDSGPVSMIPVL
jgi:hypothetical protein